MTSSLRISPRVRLLLTLPLLLLPLILGSVSSAFAQQDSLLAAKAAGQVGERPDGLLGAVQEPAAPAISELVERINGERRTYYAGVAQSTGQSVEKVQAVAGERLITATPAGQYVMNAAGRWTKK